MSSYIAFNQNVEEADDLVVEHQEEEDAHLPRVRVELDRLNYANESINNLEVEYEEAKREFLRTLHESEAELALIEKKIGNHVLKVIPYYEERMEMSASKQKYLQARFEFERAQELYVAAKNLQMYAEENLESGGENGNASDVMALERMLKLAKVKVSEREFSKQSSDLQQIEAFKVYDEHQKRVSQSEKKLKSSINKSLKYFQLKASFNKELKFFLLKVEGLKSCLKEAKSAYQQSLKNLEKISTEVHEQRNTQKATSNSSLKSSNNSKSAKTDASNINSASSPNLRNFDESHRQTRARSISMTELGDVSKSTNYDETNEEEADYDKYFAEHQLNNNELESGLGSTKMVHYTQKVDPNAICLLSDEEIEFLSIEKRLRKFTNELLGRKATQDEVVLKSVVKKENEVAKNSDVYSEVKITVPNFSKMKYM